MAMPTAIEAFLLALAWAACLSVRPWRLLQAHGGSVPPLVTPFLACLGVLPWLWSWPGLAALPLSLHWSGAPLVTLLLGWPLAVPLITLAGLSTVITNGSTLSQAVAMTFWSGLLPATLVLVLGHGVRKAFGPQPLAYMLGRAFLIPFATLAACGAAAGGLTLGLTAPNAELQRVALVLLALGEASWSCAIVSLLVAWRPQWLATWSDALYLRRPARQPAKIVRPQAHR
ncbi:hypothetical protein JJB11_18705 [Ramlibacter ginsenosidimutans]|uniref:Uncharacterized protein n=1 Tax=Ramlibacter ginsenosidimutans TaxID=502333 RepID=A0A934TVH2_9BURK|nr:hypothetical protein [Ramlibacter ginsenosidimutans]MBK6008138.1 hypothetical protein [Ramlibacter ginsenosidimutans]